MRVLTRACVHLPPRSRAHLGTCLLTELVSLSHWVSLFSGCPLLCSQSPALPGEACLSPFSVLSGSPFCLSWLLLAPPQPAFPWYGWVQRQLQLSEFPLLSTSSLGLCGLQGPLCAPRYPLACRSPQVPGALTLVLSPAAHACDPGQIVPLSEPQFLSIKYVVGEHDD